MEINKLVVNFRNAIENAKANGAKGEFFRKFPIGQCGATCDLLAQYLIDNGYKDIVYVNGTYYGDTPFDSQSHTWLEVNGLVIDITRDQFKFQDYPLKCDTPVYVGPMTAYYQQFETRPGGVFEHFGLDSSWTNYYDLIEYYKVIAQYM